MGDHNNKRPDKKIEYNTNNPSCSLYLRKITKTELCKIITDTNNDSAPGPDGISINVIKKLKDFISFILEKTFNRILKEGIIPDSFKNSLISPIYKGKGSKSDFMNYRPISLLNAFSKIFEKAINARLINYLEENNLLPNSQYGFRKGLDLSKAFDSIPHSKLLNCIKSFGIIGSAYSIFKSYLEDRTQQVKIALDRLSLNGKIYSYTDDTAIIVSSTNWESTWKKSESDIAVLG
ncbi:Reverse transcriptase domain [Cinara cedri]|uniref:Reverse transcriptase domain n=1 Tax=Cinara cedri TaxID=506608 RepID=A0A5E4N125_9HEMI|nr:Reverse transcriptase domain [Cinara cedri]